MREKKERWGCVYICVLRRMEIGVQCVLNSVCVMGFVVKYMCCEMCVCLMWGGMCMRVGKRSVVCVYLYVMKCLLFVCVV